MKRHFLTHRGVRPVAALFALMLGCVAVEGEEPAADADADADADAEDDRGIGKADHELFGSCEDSCDTRSLDGNCWCDDLCEAFGDCCSDIVEQCEAECTDDDDCRELVCPRGGFLHETCEDFHCVMNTTVLDCPDVECAEDDDCKELLCPFGGGLHEVCEDFQCKLDATIFDCPGVECEDDNDCPELVCPGGGGFAHETCEAFKCVMPEGACG